MIIRIINEKNHTEEREVERKDIQSISELKKFRYIAVDGRCYRLTAKCYTELKKKIA